MTWRWEVRRGVGSKVGELGRGWSSGAWVTGVTGTAVAVKELRAFQTAPNKAWVLSASPGPRTMAVLRKGGVQPDRCLTAGRGRGQLIEVSTLGDIVDGSQRQGRA